MVVGIALIAGCPDRALPFPLPDMAAPDDRVALACATMTSCRLADLAGVVGSFGSAMASCVSACNGIDRRDIQYSTHIDSASIDCLAAAGSDCVRATACLNGGVTPPACTPDGFSVCDGNIERDCKHGHTTSFDCTSMGLTCISDPNTSWGACGFATCTKEYEASCQGDVVATCVVGMSGPKMWVPQTDCAAIGGTCSNVNGAPSCRGKGDSCAMGSAPTCQDNLAVSCLAGRTAILDCTGIRKRCNSGKCVPFDSCAASPTCQGLVLTVCGPDGAESVDCGGLGFRGCDPTNGGRCIN
jgi:hypothetical protein